MLYSAQRRGISLSRAIQDPGVACLSYTAFALWFLGYADQALQRSQEALALAHRLSQPFSLAFALDLATALRQCRREGRVTQQSAEVLLALAHEQEFPYWLASGTVWRGWALAEQGQEMEGIAQMHQGMTAWRATGAELARPYFLALLAEAYEKEEQTEQGLAMLAEALTAVRQSGECWYEAELYRLYGELSLRIGEAGRGRNGAGEKVPSFSPIPRFPDSPFHSDPPRFLVSSPEAAFQKAIEIARRQGAKSLELRAVISLSRLWQQRGKKRKARQMLAEVYGRFGEGFGTADLQEARVLLEAMERDE